LLEVVVELFAVVATMYTLARVYRASQKRRLTVVEGEAKVADG